MDEKGRVFQLPGQLPFQSQEEKRKKVTSILRPASGDGGGSPKRVQNFTFDWKLCDFEMGDGPRNNAANHKLTTKGRVVEDVLVFCGAAHMAFRAPGTSYVREFGTGGRGWKKYRTEARGREKKGGKKSGNDEDGERKKKRFQDVSNTSS